MIEVNRVCVCILNPPPWTTLQWYCAVILLSEYIFGIESIADEGYDNWISSQSVVFGLDSHAV